MQSIVDLQEENRMLLSIQKAKTQAIEDLTHEINARGMSFLSHPSRPSHPFHPSHPSHPSHLLFPSSEHHLRPLIHLIVGASEQLLGQLKGEARAHTREVAKREEEKVKLQKKVEQQEALMNKFRNEEVGVPVQMWMEERRLLQV